MIPDRPCIVCGAPHASHGFTAAVDLELPPGQRRRIWTCERQECRDAAEARARNARPKERAG